MKNQMCLQQESIEKLIDNAITTKLASFDERYQQMIEKINSRWEDTLNKQLEKAEKDINTAVDKVIARRDALHKQPRSDPGSGSNRARKIPRPPLRNLDSVKNSLITEFMNVDSAKEDTNKNE